MNNIPLSDNSGRWFDSDSAKYWDELLDEFEIKYRESHGPELERLYLTKNGSFVLCHIQAEMACSISSIWRQAAAWLISHGHHEVAKLDIGRPKNANSKSSPCPSCDALTPKAIASYFQKKTVTES